LTALAQIKYHSILAASAQINFFLMLKNIFKLFFFRLVWPPSYTYLSSVLKLFPSYHRQSFAGSTFGAVSFTCDANQW
jgi:hypothetical protein